jgi:hypothetical protein
MVLVWSIDRLGRSLNNLEELLKELQSNGQKMTLDGHTEFLKQLQKKCGDIDELLLTARGAKESNCSLS